jgi:uncharacterized protein
MFPPEVCAVLKHYVYRLIDPRNGETFYVGRGVGNRVFAHIQAEKQSEEVESSQKLQRIRAIRNQGFEVAHIIHRHGLSETEAIEVEAAVIDAYPGLSNISAGYASSTRGSAHASQIIERYAAEEVKFNHRVVLINVNHTVSESSVYDAVRFAWKLNPKKASLAEYVLAVEQGVIIDVFVAEKWLPADPNHFPGRELIHDRFGFVGRQAPEDIRKQYVRRRTPDEMRKKGAANPIRYSF